MKKLVADLAQGAAESTPEISLLRSRDVAFYLDAREGVPALLAERASLLSLLREVEWSGGGMRCPLCGSTEAEAARVMEKGGRVVFGCHGHAPGCRLAAALKEAP